MQKQGILAHTRNKIGERHDLATHLTRVATKAKEFADTFGAGSLASWLGWLHDIGKCNLEFQTYLEAEDQGRPSKRVPHAIWGAAFIYKLVVQGIGDPEGWKELAMPVYGHHAGLPDAGELSSALEHFLSEKPDALPRMQRFLEELRSSLPPFRLIRHPASKQGTRRELFIRMLFSALVDADYLDTEAHFEPENAKLRGRWPPIDELWKRFEPGREAYLRRRYGADVRTDLDVLRVRREVYEACLQAAEMPSGIFRLTVPTGGGKTLSSLAFALKHACIHGLRRVIVALPYTSIIDQTARVYREVLGEDAVLEHHSAFEFPESEDERQDMEAVRLRLASENWEAPLIVTTTVQLFESLFHNKPSKCRKLHNIVKSVIILDEVQALPPHILEPTLDVLRALVEDYGVTVVLSTATQPAFEGKRFVRVFPTDKLRGEIVPQYPEHFRLLQRVRYEYRREPLSWNELAEEIQELPQVMVVLNTRRDAVRLVEELGEGDDIYHLSTLLCGAHRREILEEIRQRLAAGAPVKLISTQVVEAGVDFDFPVVYRAIGPLERIVQVAGRCNREGRLGPRGGRVILFEPAEGGAPRGPYLVGLEKAKFLLQEYSEERLHDPELYREYFLRLYLDVPLDKNKVQGLREELSYPKVAERYRLIEDPTVPVVVSYGDALRRLEAWQRSPGWATWQRLQPYVVNLYEREARCFEREGWLEMVTEGLYRWRGRYDPRTGIVGALYDPSDLIL
ncbi:CRISPR-associated helicase Cas3' [Candidatus Bipolaricaulota bacterium]|nr:CRISPR-associated helicase Cas3' [Candidatus Bipolaricaulota bacterium]